MKSSEALKKVRKCIEDRSEVYVCYALANADAKHTAVYKRLDELFRDHNGTMSIIMWLYKKGYTSALTDATVEDKREYRLRWIDWMIEGYEKVGD
jgi:hypothetical protein